MSFWSEHNVFVTGASGLLGSWLVEELLARQARVTCLLRDWVPSSRLFEVRHIDRVNVVRGQVEDYGLLVRALNEYEIDTVFHLGAQTIVGTALRSAMSTFESNVRGTWTVLEACLECSRLVKRIVVASSDKAYGPQEKLPYTEQTPLAGRAPYDVSKTCADLISLSYASSYGLPVAVTRCGNLFGPGDLNYNRLIPGTIRSVLRGERPIIRSDGKMIRDYFFVRDAARAYLALAEKLVDHRLAGQAFNFGNDNPLSVLEAVGHVLRVMQRPDLEPVVLNQAPHEIPAQFLDCSKARSTLGWHPECDFDEGLRLTVPWYRDCLSSSM